MELKTRLFIILLALSLLPLAACGQETASAQPTDTAPEAVPVQEPVQAEEAQVSAAPEESSQAAAGPEDSEKTTLYLADMSNNRYLIEAILEFNALSDIYEVEHVLYIPEDETRLRLELISGSGPDIMSLHRFGYEAYANKGVFADLNSFFDSDPDISRGMLLEQILDACEESDGQLFQLMPTFHFETMWCNPEFYAQLGEWNIGTISDWLTQHPDACFTTYTYDYNSPFYLLMRAGLNDFVDYETMTCQFDSPEFQNLLTCAKALWKNTQSVSPEDFREGRVVGAYINFLPLRIIIFWLNTV